ncbi:Ldh family oxidoreductase [Paenirhodobacter populi]|uniref:Delta(1)-pyrroline-2-carboxylate/Delta(1)-piperideine-2-carboxylate reductase n=1 Tax=Paenirhodobacter populi TaxID=2306993 RepID=A0A443JI36_9RHOB|nr:Ldh family oxidoreductase [Sinirhodobacter populi]RWR20161.1 Ldh family oxidoreductase [Sinirhodobacter populi]
MGNPSAEDTAIISETELRGIVARILERNGCRSEVAGILAANCVGAERDGSVSHGLFRVEGYIASLRSGWVDGTAVPVLEDKAPGCLAVDAKNGFTQIALDLARGEFTARIRQNGIALLLIRNSHHLAALWPDVEPFAEEGLIALSMINSMTCSVPQGAKKPVFGTNPFALAAPAGKEGMLVFDMATTTTAHGDVQVARREGHMLPPGTGVDRDGNPTGDPAKILDGGALVPFGGHKGSLISLMVELLCAGLGGGHFSWEFDWSGHPGAATPHTGQIFIGIDPSKAGGLPFGMRAETLVEKLREAGLSHLPGRRRHDLRAARAGQVPVAAARLAHLRDLAEGRAG